MYVNIWLRKTLKTTCLILFVGIFSVQTSQAKETGSFTGTWSANGELESLAFGNNREIALYKLTGHVNLTSNIGRTSDYWSQCFGLAETQLGGVTHCVWRGRDGSEILITLSSESMNEGATIKGQIVGGTGAAKGITGSLQLEWKTLRILQQNKTRSVGGYSRNLHGTYSLP